MTFSRKKPSTSRIRLRKYAAGGGESKEMRSSICKDDLNAQRLQKRLKRSDK